METVGSRKNSVSFLGIIDKVTSSVLVAVLPSGSL